MSEIESFLGRLLRDGVAFFRARPEPLRGQPAGVVRVVREAYGAYRLDVPGAPIALDVEIACEAAEVVRQACWAMVSREESDDVLAARIRWTRAAGGPSDHLSADLFLRYLPRVYRRARAATPGDRLVGLIADVLRRRPLSGVLAGLDEPPLVAPEFGGHAGLMRMYAERFAESGRPAWEPTGAAREHLDLVRQATAGRASA